MLRPVRLTDSTKRRKRNNGLSTLGLDHADVLLLGWYDRFPPPQILAAAADLRHRGRVRHLAISTHQRPLAREFPAPNKVSSDATVLGWGPATLAGWGGVFVKDPGKTPLVGDSSS